MPVEEAEVIAAAVSRDLAQLRERSSAFASRIGMERAQIHERARSSARRASAAAATIAGVTTGLDKLEDTAGLPDRVRGLAEASHEVGGLAEAVKGIAASASNAALDAARVSEAGRGVTVVAEAVRGLASETRDAADRVGRLAAGLANEAEAIVRSLGGGLDIIERGVRAVRVAEHEVTEIAAAMHLDSDAAGSSEMALPGAPLLDDIVERISTACDELRLLASRPSEEPRGSTAGITTVRFDPATTDEPDRDERDAVTSDPPGAVVSASGHDCATEGRLSPATAEMVPSRTHSGLRAEITAALPRSLLIASIVGTILVLVNQGDRLTDFSTGLMTRCFLTYLTPFVVSMIGWLASARAHHLA